MLILLIVSLHIHLNRERFLFYFVFFYGTEVDILQSQPEDMHLYAQPDKKKIIICRYSSKSAIIVFLFLWPSKILLFLRSPIRLGSHFYFNRFSCSLFPLHERKKKKCWRILCQILKITYPLHVIFLIVKSLSNYVNLRVLSFDLNLMWLDSLKLFRTYTRFLTPYQILST